ncbi:hypothetical protein MHYP_G00130500 [Metynnis hypsauchen]
MQCQELLVQWLSWGMILAGLVHLLCFLKSHAPYGRYMGSSFSSWMVPARLAWFIQELPALLLPLLLLLSTSDSHQTGRCLLLSTFCLHYFQRTCVYSLLTRGRPYPLNIMVSGIIFCSVNGFLQAHHLLHCLIYPHMHLSDGRTLIGMAINMHSDHVLRNLRKPGETTYKIPQGGLFEFVSGANFFGEIVEWLGYATATWSLPTFAFAFFTMCFIGPRAYHHHRYH